MIQAAALTTGLAQVAATAECLVAGRQALLDQPAVEPGAARCLRIAVQLQPVLRAIAIDMIKRQALRRTAAGAFAAVVTEHLLPQRCPAISFPGGIVVMPGAVPQG